jgi:RimJ/RimL family protein N-acetyltransferase
MSGFAVLRDVVDSDLPVLYEQQLDPEALRMAAFKSRDWDPFRSHWARILADETITKRVVVVDGKVAGHFVSWSSNGEQEVGYWIGRAFWGRGVATRGLSTFLGFARVRPLSAHVAKHNAASIRVLEKCGFVRVGENAEHLILHLEAEAGSEGA